MKKYIFMIMCSLVAFSTQGQQLGEVTWKKVSHEVRQLVITNENIQSELDSMLFRTKQNTLLSVFKKYEYLRNYSAVVMACQFFKPQTRLEQRYMEFFRVSWRSQ